MIIVAFLIIPLKKGGDFFMSPLTGSYGICKEISRSRVLSRLIMNLLLRGVRPNILSSSERIADTGPPNWHIRPKSSSRSWHFSYWFLLNASVINAVCDWCCQAMVRYQKARKLAFQHEQPRRVTDILYRYKNRDNHENRRLFVILYISRHKQCISQATR